MNRENLHQSLAAVNEDLFCDHIWSQLSPLEREWFLGNVFVIGTQLGWVSPTIAELKRGEDGPIADNEQISKIASISEMSRFFGSLLPAILLDSTGRKPIVLISSFLLFLSWLTMTFARSITVIYFAKLLFGIAQGIFDAIISIYLAENCTPKMRGILSGIIPLCLCTSNILEYVLVPYESFSFVATVNAIIGFASLSTCIFLKETPYYLVMKGRAEEAIRNLLWLRGKNVIDSDIKYEMDQIQQNMQQEIEKKRSLVSLFGNPENYKSLILVSAFSFLVPMVGAKIVMTYSTMIFQASSVFSETDFTILYAILQLISACISPFLIERFNRRTLLLNLLSVMGVSNIFSFFLFWMRMYIANKYFSWLIFRTATTTSFLFYWAYPLMVIVRSELLPMSVRAIGGSLNIMASAIGASICLRLFLPITDSIGVQYNFVLSFICCIFQFILVLTVLPETRGKTLVDIQMSSGTRK